VVLVITQHDLPEPRTDFGHALVHPALKLNLDGFEFRNHPSRSDMCNDKAGSAPQDLPCFQHEQSRLVCDLPVRLPSGSSSQKQFFLGKLFAHIPSLNPKNF
jgi:hypothetical protein